PFAFSPFLLLLTSPPEFSTLSLHDALPILRDLSQQGCYLDADNPLPLGTTVHVRMMKGGRSLEVQGRVVYNQPGKGMGLMFTAVDRKSTRLNSSHRTISYAVFCLKKKT